MSDALTVMVGLPESGKTTYLAALWHVVNRGEAELTLDHLAGDQSYLNRICDEWRRCTPTVRTSRAAETRVAMFLRDDHGDVTELHVPDVSGESYNDFWEHRGWPTRFDELIARMTGVMLFVHAGNLRQPEFLDELSLLTAGEEDEQASKEEDVLEWSPALAADQVKLVELMQFIRERAQKPIPVAIIVSAWDLVPEVDRANPNHWFARRVPLLAQYLDVQSGWFPRRVWGISAQGGDLEAKRAELLQVEPSRRIEVVTDVDTEGLDDLTSPFRWLLEQRP